MMPREIKISQKLIPKTTNLLATLLTENLLPRKELRKIKRTMTWRRIWMLYSLSRWRKSRSSQQKEMMCPTMNCYWVWTSSKSKKMSRRINGERNLHQEISRIWNKILRKSKNKRMSNLTLHRISKMKTMDRAGLVQLLS